MLAGEGGTQRLLSEVSPVLRWSPVGGGLSLHPDISFHRHCSVAFYHDDGIVGSDMLSCSIINNCTIRLSSSHHTTLT